MTSVPARDYGKAVTSQTVDRGGTSRALFLDRDGVINVDHGYVYERERFEYIDGIFDACRGAVALGYKVIVVTNQAGIGRGYFSEADFVSLTKWMSDRFEDEGASLTDVLFCPFHPEHGVGAYKKDSPDRKPKPGMLLRAARLHNIDLASSILVGDKATDIEAGAAAGVGKLLLLGQEGLSSREDLSFERITSLLEIVRWL